MKENGGASAAMQGAVAVNAAGIFGVNSGQGESMILANLFTLPSRGGVGLHHGASLNAQVLLTERPASVPW